MNELDFDIELSPSVMHEMYLKQYNLQGFMHTKRGLQSPPALASEEISHAHSLAAIYFSSCVNLEWLELQVEYEKLLKLEAECTNSLEAQSVRRKCLDELVDVWHFSLAVLIFLGFKPEQAQKLYHFRLGALNSLAEHVGETSLAISKILEATPYKTWKNQEGIKHIDTEYADLLFEKASVVFNSVMDFALDCLGSSYEEFTDTYNAKNQRNFDRQVNPAHGYIGE